MYKIADKVKVIPSSYIDLSKTFLNYRETWNKVNTERDEHLMLGGEYTIRSVENTTIGIFYKLIEGGTNNSGKASERQIKLANNVMSCPFHVGDRVVFSPKCSEEDIQYLEALGYGVRASDPPAKEHKVTAILNDYYVFVDVPKNDPRSFPFRWIDFELSGRS